MVVAVTLVLLLGGLGLRFLFELLLFFPMEVAEKLRAEKKELRKCYIFVAIEDMT